MIVLDNNEKDIVIPDYNDLENKPSINGVVLEGNKTAGELGIDIDTTNFYTKSQADSKFQPKGDYLTSIPDEYITETELNSKNYATNSYVNDEIVKLNSALSAEISKKQNALVSGENIKTINGESILGNGNIEISSGESVDLSDYYTKGEVDNLIDNVEVDLTGYATETYVSNNYQPKGDYLTSIPSEYITETELTNKGYATTTQLNSKQDKLISGTNIKTINGNSILGGGNIELVTDLTGYATETWVLNKGYLTSIPSEYITETELNSKNYATKSEIPTIPTNISAFTNDSGYITNSALNGYATETYVSNNYQPKGDYLTSVPSEYITETELNDAIAGLSGNDIPYVCILLNQNAIKEYVGDLQAVIEAVINKTPYLAYARTFEDLNDYGTDLGPSRTTIPLTATYNNNEGSSGYKTGNFGYHTELSGNSLRPHLDVKINFKYDNTTESYILTTISKVIHNYLTSDYYGEYLAPVKQDKLVSGTNIKTINGNSILGSGDLLITTDLSNYYTKTEIDTQIGDINTILENIIG